MMANTRTTGRLDSRRGAILNAARALFIEKGYEQTTLADIVNHAGGSLATIYKLFGNKDRLLEAVVLDNAASGEAIVREVAEAGLAPAPALHAIARGLHQLFLDPRVVAIVRVVIARSVSDPQFARQFFERTAHRTRNAIEALLGRWQAEGIALNGSPEFLADMFMGLLVSDLQTQAISHGAMGSAPPERLSERTEFFLTAAGIPHTA